MADKKSYSFMKDIKQAFSLDNAVLKYMQNNTPYKALQDLASKVKGTKPKTTPSIVTSAIKASRQPGMLVDAGGFDRRKTTPSNSMFKGLNKPKSNDRRGKPDGEVIYKKRKPVAASKSYKIKSGDTLSAIAAKNGTTVAALKKLNSIKDVNKIRAGASLKMPSKVVSSPTSRPKKSTPTSKANTVTLKDGTKGTPAQRLKELDKEKAAQATMSAAKQALANKKKKG